MSRKVNLTVTARVMVPVILTYKVVAVAEDNVPMKRLALAAIKGQVPSGVDIHDATIERMHVDGAPDLETPIDEMINDYIEGEDVSPKYLRHDVDDSR